MATTPNPKGKTMETPTITLTIGKVRPADLTTAKHTVSEYREQGNGSNRTKWERVTVLLSVVLTVVGSGKSVEITDLFDGQDGDKTNGSPAYHQAHRALSHGAIRPLWDQVQVVALKDTTDTKTTVTGVSSTTAKVGRVRVFITPVA